MNAAAWVGWAVYAAGWFVAAGLVTRWHLRSEAVTGVPDREDLALAILFGAAVALMWPLIFVIVPVAGLGWVFAWIWCREWLKVRRIERRRDHRAAVTARILQLEAELRADGVDLEESGTVHQRAAHLRDRAMHRYGRV